MPGNLSLTTDHLTRICEEAFLRYPKSCSHSVWHVIKQYNPSQQYMVANELISHINSSTDWKEVQPSELSELASDGTLIVGGLIGKAHGHVITVYPGNEKKRGGYVFYNRTKRNDEEMPEKGSYAKAMSTSIGSWPGAMSNGDKTVWDPWGNDTKFKAVRFWKYVGPANNDLSLSKPKKPIKTAAGAQVGQKRKRRVKKLRVQAKLKEKERWSFKTFTDCFDAMNRKWQRAFK